MKFRILFSEHQQPDPSQKERLTTVPPLYDQNAIILTKLETLVDARRTHEDEALTGTLSLACCTVVGLTGALLLPPRVAR